MAHDLGLTRLGFGLLILGACTRSVHDAQPDLPIINLGYVRQRATSYEPATDTFIFKNARYAQAPLGDLRFRLPQPPTPETGVTDGAKYGDRVCSQPYLDSSGISNTVISEDCLVRTGNWQVGKHDLIRFSSWMWSSLGPSMPSRCPFLYGFTAADIPRVAKGIL